jgi:hypothetical protein
MAKDSQIVLLGNSYKLSNITSPDVRENLARTLIDLDQSSLTETEIRKTFEALKLAMGVFMHKVSTLEASISTLRREQVAAESRMEAMYLRAQLEIRELRTEISDMKMSRGRINQIVKVAKALQGNAYAPYAVKSLVDGVISNSATIPFTTKESKLDHTKLPEDFPTRLDFAQQNGFKWNQNNRVPSKSTKQLQILEEWENQFFKVEKMTIEEVLNKSFVVKEGPGAIAGALMMLERELGEVLAERATHSVFNCYQKAIRLYKDRQASPATSERPAQIPCNFDVKSLLLGAFSTLSVEDAAQLENRLKMRVLETPEQVVVGLKKVMSKSLLPTFLQWNEEDEKSSEVQKLYSIQAGSYDSQILQFVQRYEQVGFL